MERVLVAIPTQGRRNVSRLGESMQQLPAKWDPVLFLNGNYLLDADIPKLESDSGLKVIRLSCSGYASSRNAILDWAADYESLVFFDDDQVPCLGWAQALGAAQLSGISRPAAVLGPVMSIGARLGFIAGEWSRGKQGLVPQELIFRGPGYSGNTMLHLAFVREKNLRFETRFDSDGGEDTAFFAALRNEGGVIHFAPNALAVEFVDSDRLTAMGVFRAGRTSARRNYLLNSERKRMLLRIAGRLVVVPVFTIAALATIDRYRLARGIYSAGMIVQYLSDFCRGSQIEHARHPKESVTPARARGVPS